MGGTAGVFVGAAVVVIVVALLFVLMPTRAGAPQRRRTPRLPSGSVTHRFGDPEAPPRRDRVQQRLERAVGRIDTIDPHVNQRRIGQVLQPRPSAPRPSGPPVDRPALPAEDGP